MSVHTVPAAEAIARLDEFDAIIDARSEAEYAQDHLPGAVNWPSLNDEERKLIGTIYEQVSPFEAQKRGAALVAANIAAPHRARGDRQAAQLAAAGLLLARRQAQRLAGAGPGPDRLSGQRDRRRLQGLSQRRAGRPAGSWRRGSTSAWSAAPPAPARRACCRRWRRPGAQVLDLEALASHRSSVLGMIPGQPQPTQKRFDTLVWDALRRFDPARPVFVESESKQGGQPGGARRADRAHARQPLPAAGAARRRARGAAAGGLRLLRARPGAVLRPAGGADRAARQGRGAGLAGAGGGGTDRRRWCASCCSSTTTRAMRRRSRATSAVMRTRRRSRRRTARRQRWPNWPGRILREDVKRLMQGCGRMAGSGGGWLPVPASSEEASPSPGPPCLRSALALSLSSFLRFLASSFCRFSYP